MIVKVLLFIALGVWCLHASSQEKLSDEKLISDFEYLYSSLKQSSITMDIYSQEHRVDIDSLYEVLKSELIEQPTFNDFIRLSQKLFNVSGDLHNNFVSSYSLSSLLPYLPESEREATIGRVDTTKYEISDNRYAKIYDYTKNQRTCLRFLKTRYFNGKYYVLYDTKIAKQKIPYGSEIIQINGINPNEYVLNNLSNYFVEKDIVSGNYYSTNLFNNLLSDNDTLRISFALPKGDKVECIVNNSTKIDYSYAFITFNFKNDIFYLNKENLLYIKIIFQEDTPKLIEKLDKYKNKDIDRIVIDVRGNPGGSDLHWINLMSEIVDTIVPIKSPKLLVKNNELMKNQFKDEKIEMHPSEAKLLQIENDILDYIKPSTNGFKFDGTIYCVRDNISFSSAMAFVSLNQYLANFKVVGFESPYYGGFGATPMYFMLPNSKLIYRVNATFDNELFETQNYRLHPDIAVKPSVSEELDFKNQAIRRYRSKGYRIKQNIYLKAILDVEH